MSKKELVVMDGNEAAAYIAYAFTEIAAIYPITPSSPMAEKTDVWSATGKKNLFGQSVKLIEMQSEAGAIGAVHGAVETGALATSFTSSQGLMLMIPVLHRISGQLHPAVLHVAARTVGTHAMSIFGDHSDVMNCRQTGWAQLCSGSVQEVMDIAAVAHLAAIKGRVPFMHFFDGFRTSHEISKIEKMDYADLEPLLDREALALWRSNALNPDHPVLRSTVQNPDIYFQVREATNRFYDALPDIVEDYLAQISDITGREYHLFNYYGDPFAEDVIVAMGSVSSTIKETVDWLNSRGRRVGFLQVHLYRPFSVRHFIEALPNSTQRIAVLDRCKEMGAVGQPLYEDVCAAFNGTGAMVDIIGGHYGLSSKDTDPAQIIAVYDNLASQRPKNGFTIGIEDDVTGRSLDCHYKIYPDAPRQHSLKFWGLGGDGTVGANKNTVNIIAENTDKYGQAYFEYDAKKSLGVTISNLRFSDEPIRSSYLVRQADFIAAHNKAYVLQDFDVVEELRHGGTFLLNCSWKPEELEQMLPAKVKRALAERNANFYIIDANEIAARYGLGNHVNIPLQSAFFHLADVIPVEDAVKYMKRAIKISYSAKGDEVIAKNIAAIEDGGKCLVKIEIPESWKTATDETQPRRTERDPKIIREMLDPMNVQKGDKLPVSTFLGYEDGTFELGLTAYEKRCIATQVPEWDPQKCIQCNRCSLVCPHAVIRPYLMTEEESAAAPKTMLQKDAIGFKDMKFTMLISKEDCTGCGSCVPVCPAKEKAIKMVAVEESKSTQEEWQYGLTISDKKPENRYTVKNSQFYTPLVEFSAACAGCGETPYAKLLTQLFGERVYWANATGCTQAWGSGMPGIPYTKNKEGKGPAWSNSLFEDNAEFSLGMCLSVKHQREAEQLRAQKLAKLLGEKAPAEITAWLDAFNDFDKSATAGEALAAVLEKEADGYSDEAKAIAREILQNRDQLSKKTFWMYGGDGWAYDIGYGGLDHVLASGENVNVFIVDTEVYSNTGGQSSKATPLGAVAQFCKAGKTTVKKNLGAIFMSYGNVYVAQVAMGADPAQLVKAIKEAEEYDGPSLIISYAPCIAHGILLGMNNTQAEMKRAVDSGYWSLYRYDPRKEKPFTLDSKEPTLPYEEFLDGEVRYNVLKRTFPEHAKEFFAKAAKDARRHYDHFKRREENQ